MYYYNNIANIHKDMTEWSVSYTPEVFGVDVANAEIMADLLQGKNNKVQVNKV